MRRAWLAVTGTAVVLCVLAGAGGDFRSALGVGSSPIVVGLLHSRTGPMAISEASMIDAEILALEEINAAGGLLGRPLRWVVADGESDPATYARLATRLIENDKVSVVF